MDGYIHFSQDTRGNHTIEIRDNATREVLEHIHLDLHVIAKNPAQLRETMNGLANILSGLSAYLPQPTR